MAKRVFRERPREREMRLGLGKGLGGGFPSIYAHTLPENTTHRLKIGAFVINQSREVKWGCDLQSEHERYLTEEAFSGCPVIVRDYPKVGELIGGSQREERLEYFRKLVG